MVVPPDRYYRSLRIGQLQRKALGLRAAVRCGTLAYMAMTVGLTLLAVTSLFVDGVWDVILGLLFGAALTATFINAASARAARLEAEAGDLEAEHHALVGTVNTADRSTRREPQLPQQS